MNARTPGFTLTEMLVALAVGMFVLNIAFSSFFFTQKFIRKIEAISAKNDVVQSQIEWVLTGRADLDYPNKAQLRLIGGTISASGGRKLLTINIYPNASTTTPSSTLPPLTIPAL